jgi:ATP synthase protein I
MDKSKPDRPTSKDSLSKRIQALESRQNKAKGPSPHAQLPTNGLALAGRVTTELLAGLIVGTGIGWALDQWLNTTPMMMVLMFFLGAAAGMMNVWRALTGRGMAAGFFKESHHKPDKRGDDETK